MQAAVRANKREVSISSPARIQSRESTAGRRPAAGDGARLDTVGRGSFSLASPEPGKIANRMPRAPR